MCNKTFGQFIVYDFVKIHCMPPSPIHPITNTKDLMLLNCYARSKLGLVLVVCRVDEVFCK